MTSQTAGGTLSTWSYGELMESEAIIILGLQYTGRVSNINLVYGLALHEFFVAQSR